MTAEVETTLLAAALVACLLPLLLAQRQQRSASPRALLATQHAVARQLADKETLEGAAPRILQAVCEHLGWSVGTLWVLDDQERLIPSSSWNPRDDAAPGVSGGATLAARVLRERKSLWVPSLAREGRPFDGRMASAMAFPITCGYRVLGALVFFSRRPLHADARVLGALAVMGAEIGHFMERRRAARALFESERRLRLVADSVLDAVVTTDQSGLIMSWNHAAQDLFGYEPREVLGRPVVTLLPTRYHDVPRHMLRRLMAGGRAMHEGQTVRLHALHKDGSEFPAEAAVSFWRTPEGAFGIGVVRDLGGRRKRTRPLDLSRDAPDPRWNLVHSVVPGLGEMDLLVAADAGGAGEALTRFLADYSHDVRGVAATSACGLLEWLPHAVLLDVAVSGSPLLELAGELRHEAGSSEVPMLMLCGPPLAREQRQRLDRMGVDVLERDGATCQEIRLWLGRVVQSGRGKGA